MKKLLIIPAFNEEQNILNVCKIVEQYNQTHNGNLDYIVINDGSTDNTARILLENKLPHVNLINNLGIGGAVQTGYKYAYQNDYDIAIQFDGDGQHDINYVEKICKPIEEGQADMVIGSRYKNKKKSKFQSTFMRRFGARLISFFILIFCWKRIKDPTSGFRAVNRDVIKEFSIFYPREYPEPESIVSLVVNGYTIKEEPVSMNARKGGVSSIRFWKTIDYMVKVLLSVMIDSLSLRKKRRDK